MENLVGYAALIEKYNLNVIPHYRISLISSQSKREILINNGHEKHIYSKKYALKDHEDVFLQLELSISLELVP